MDDRVVWRAVQACKSDAREHRAGSGKGAGFADALIVFKALQAGLDTGHSLGGVYTFD